MAAGEVVAITGIDTDIGKTIATGLLGRFLLLRGYTVITQKVVQTGCVRVSEDIVRHRQLMGMSLQHVDRNGLTCPYIFPEPCSPHLAASLAGKKIDCQVISAATSELQRRYRYVLMEGAGGLLVPLTAEVTFLDYLQQQNYPLILVSSPRLGSINHTLAALELAKTRGLVVKGIVYNRFRDDGGVIADDSKRVFSSHLCRYGFADVLVEVFASDMYAEGLSPDFGRMFNFIESE